MNKTMVFAVLALLCVSTKSFAADISGRVAAAEGEPICALVLASGVSMFSCDPIGVYSLPGLPLEPDGSIKLQVYADGFLPYIKILTQFGPQPVVTMTRAGSSPVDDGLSNIGPLDGTYRLIRSSVIYNDSSGFDTAQSNIQATGTMVINGNIMTQQLTLTVNGIPQPPFSTQTSFIDYGYYLSMQNPSGVDTPTVLVERGSKLITFANGNNSGFPFTEVDQWAKVTSTVTSLQSDVSSQSYTPATVPLGTLLGAMAEGQGLKMIPDK